MNNGDEIRNKTNEELARFIMQCKYENNPNPILPMGYNKIYQIFLDWLNTEVNPDEK